MNQKIISLKNVSKFYYSKGVIASGFAKINLDFEMGEFVAITGESGSGKSTLLNVLSGLDTYEEGEMLINGEETSHYSEKDFEDYRRKYIGNIFQNFNLINSYTVYQNVEIVLLLNGEKKKSVKAKVIDLIKKVDLYKFRNTKVSKLSGGQKQRVAIARALAKDTPVIIADEPTGNLDSESAAEVIRLLSEIAKDRLVIIVTHNYEQIEPYVTRKIKMHDGKVLEDKVLKKNETKSTDKVIEYKNITFFNKIRLGWRNTFNILPKFLLLLLFFLFVTIATMSSYSSTKEQKYLLEKSGDNYIFTNTDNHRIVLKKQDLSAFTQEDFEFLESVDNVSSVVKNDLLIDNFISLTDNDAFWIDGTAINLETLKGDLDLGRMPENDNEVILECYEDNYLAQTAEEVMGKTLYILDSYSGMLVRRPHFK
jgi:ABC-type lipoprotein export system ATPase subunit